MKITKSAIILIASVLMLTGCMPGEIVGRKPNGGEVHVTFYPGGLSLNDLMIIEGVNYFGTAQYQIDDPLADIGFRLESGERAQAECISVSKNILGEDECAQYEVYRSSFDLIPSGTVFSRPEMY